MTCSAVQLMGDGLDIYYRGGELLTSIDNYFNLYFPLFVLSQQVVL